MHTKIKLLPICGWLHSDSARNGPIKSLLLCHKWPRIHFCSQTMWPGHSSFCMTTRHVQTVCFQCRFCHFNCSGMRPETMQYFQACITACAGCNESIIQNRSLFQSGSTPLAPPTRSRTAPQEAPIQKLLRVYVTVCVHILPTSLPSRVRPAPSSPHANIDPAVSPVCRSAHLRSVNRP